MQTIFTTISAAQSIRWIEEIEREYPGLSGHEKREARQQLRRLRQELGHCGQAHNCESGIEVPF
jgi:hypothetical protein